MDEPGSSAILADLFFRELWENSPDNMFVVRRKDGDFFIHSVNPAQERAVSVKGSEITGKKLSDVFPAALYDRFVFNYSNCLDGRIPVRYEESFLNADGLYTYWETFLMPVFPEKAGGEYVYGICRDITPLREAEQKYSELSKAAEQVGKSKISFLANMSHEMRTPLNGISSAVSLFLESTDQKEKQELADIINSSVESLSRITNDVLDFARLNSGTLRLELSEFTLSGFIQHVFQVVSPMMMGRDISLLFDVSDDLPETLYGDTIRIGQILINLIGNAIKFTNHGEVKVSARVLESDSGIVKIEICVSDTGIGILEEDIPVLFQPFSQIDSSSTRRFSGAGLGLAISRQLAELMGGYITVKSSLGQGSTFKVRLPLKTAIPLRTLQSESPMPKSAINCGSEVGSGDLVEPGKTKGVVLVVEDNHVNSMVASRILKKGGFGSVCVFNGKDAVDYCRSNPVDIILMDWHMPVMDGLEATRRIRELPGCLSLPIIGLTANALKEHMDLCINAGMNDVLTKPINRDQMLSKVRYWVELAE